MDNLATLNVFCHTKRINATDLSEAHKLSLHKSRADALLRAFEDISNLWSVKDWGFTTLNEFHEDVYVSLECQQPEQLEIDYIQEDGKLTGVRLPKAIIALLSQLLEKQRSQYIGKFSLFTLQNQMQINCGEDEKADFKFSMKAHHISFDADLNRPEFVGKPSIRFD